MDLRARLRADVKPSELQDLLEEHVTTATRAEPHIVVEEVDGDEVVVRIEATPRVASEGRELADEILSAVAAVTRDAGAAPRSRRRRRSGPASARPTWPRARTAERRPPRALRTLTRQPGGASALRAVRFAADTWAAISARPTSG